MSHFVGLSPLFIQNCLQWAKGVDATVSFYDADPVPTVYELGLPVDALLGSVPVRLMVGAGAEGITTDFFGLSFPPTGDVLKAGIARVGRLAIPSPEGEAWVTMSVAEGLSPDFTLAPLWVHRAMLKPSDKIVLLAFYMSFASLFVK